MLADYALLPVLPHTAGPSKCPSIAVMQPQGASKTLKARPAWKAFIRNRMPECCPVRAVFAWLSCRFLLNAEAMPAPGDTDFLLFPGSSADAMSLNNHSRIIQKIFDMVDIDPPKVTHEFRVFAAQALHDMGVSLEVSQLAARNCFGLRWRYAVSHIVMLNTAIPVQYLCQLVPAMPECC